MQLFQIVGALWLVALVGWHYHEEFGYAALYVWRALRFLWIWSVVRPVDLVKRARLPKGHIRHRSRHHQVNAHWVDKHPGHGHLHHKSHWELHLIRDRLLRKSNKTKVPLPAHEQALVRALDAHRSVRNGIDFAQGRHHREFGFTGADQLHGATAGLPCGCSLTVIHDHGPQHPHHPKFLCPKHEHLRDAPHHVRHARIEADNQPKT